MGARIGFGILNAFSEPNADEKADAIQDLANKGWISKFTEVDIQTNIAYFFDLDAGQEISQKNLDPADPLFAIAQHVLPIDFDDWAIIFEFEVFLPNSTLSDCFVRFSIGDEEKRISSLGYGILLNI